MNLTPEDWEAVGYTRFNQGRSNSADFGLQKCVRDEQGKKYYLTVWAYDNRKYQQQHPDITDWSFAPALQFNQGVESSITTNIELILGTDDTIEKIEAYIENLWILMGSHYYEAEYSER